MPIMGLCNCRAILKLKWCCLIGHVLGEGTGHFGRIIGLDLHLFYIVVFLLCVFYHWLKDLNLIINNVIALGQSYHGAMVTIHIKHVPASIQ